MKLWFRPYGESLLSNSHKRNQKGLAPGVRPSLRSGSLTPVPLRGHAATGHPWPMAALPASMPVDPLRRTSSRPPDGAGRSKSKTRSKTDQKQIKNRSKTDQKQIKSRFKAGALAVRLFCSGLGIEPGCSYLLIEAITTGPRLTPTVC